MRKMMMSLFFLFFAVSLMAQQGKLFNITCNDEPMSSVFKKIGKLSGVRVDFAYEDVNPYRVTVSLKNVSAQEAVKSVIGDYPLTFTIKSDGKFIVVSRQHKVIQQQLRRIQAGGKGTTVIHGKVVDASNSPMPGVNVSIKGKEIGTTTDANGFYTIYVNKGSEETVLFTFIGMKTEIAKISCNSEEKELNVVLRENASELSEVVVTGIYTRKKESFTGSATTYTQKELRQEGSMNVLQSLKTLDPAFVILDDTKYGSDPNHMPNMEIRGKSSMIGTRDNLETDPNQPLFILDGFESSLQAINDLDINRIESITLLKDAASTAIYGSKAANGVVVVETVKPKAGKLQVSYIGNMNVTIPDLSSYNLMNASEKLQFELLSGKYDPSIVETPYRTGTEIELEEAYNERLREIAEGVDTYWLSQPLRTGINQKHSLYVMGGGEGFMFGLGGGYNGTTGVMKDSQRDVLTGNIDLIYRVKKFQFSNKFSVTSTDYRNPVVEFSQYAQTNPYYRKTNAEGSIDQWLEYNDTYKIANPLWNASLNSRYKGKDLELSNYFVAEWHPNEEWMVRGRAGITYDNSDTENFISPLDTRQILSKASNKRGDYTSTNTRLNQYEGEFTITYAKMLGLHRINAVVGGNIYSSKTVLQGYSAEGFPEGDFTYPSFASGYTEGGQPTYYETVSHSLNGYLNTGYSFDDRYLMDFSLRTSGSSVFGSTRKYNTTWSVGLGWNLHREKFIAKHVKWIDYFKLRASVGNPGNQSFDSGKTLVTYAFQYGMTNYFGLGALPDQIGNKYLKWQITKDKNIGLDLTILKKKLSFTFDYYHKVTDPLLIGINLPSSSGTSYYYTNAGKQTSKGLTFTAIYNIIRDTEHRLLWSIRVNGRTEQIRLGGIDNKLDQFNTAGRGSSTVRYYNGYDPDDIWAVRSAGIDPSTGKELYYTKEGKFTYDFNYNNEVKVGNTRPDLQGILGTSFTCGGFSLTLNFRYQLGADVFNSALMSKVENVNMLYNQDRRALYDRWQKVGDICQFKNIRDANSSPISSRFVQSENVLSLESIYLEYEFLKYRWLKRVGLGNFKVFFSMRDVFRASTVRAERGTDYPFARTLNAGLSFNF